MALLRRIGRCGFIGVEGAEGEEGAEGRIFLEKDPEIESNKVES